ncbi:uncharacterized protein LOC135071435 isoform X1 [Ostrinia nubilalis]|uniref:uncharacterized protein LOC135071435 isoform X1 n=1 Tax=Ostrinia nubilalis TaxID=29057 RepID=UPI0030825312
MENRKPNKYGVIEDLLGLTDSEDSSSSSNTGVFETHQPFVLELHDLVKDDPAAENPAPEAKVKKHRKKKGQPGANQGAASDTSSSVSESSVPPTGLEEHSREEFYDAHESYHGLTENQAAANPVAAAGLVQARSEHGPTPKLTQEQTNVQQTQGSASRREPSTTVTKPTANPK